MEGALPGIRARPLKGLITWGPGPDHLFPLGKGGEEDRARPGNNINLASKTPSSFIRLFSGPEPRPQEWAGCVRRLPI